MTTWIAAHLDAVVALPLVAFAALILACTAWTAWTNHQLERWYDEQGATQ